MYWNIQARYTGEIEDYTLLDKMEGDFDVDNEGRLFWNRDIEREPHPLGQQRIIELSWGWTPFGDGEGDDTHDPEGHESVFILEHQLSDLIEQLQTLLEK